MTKNFSNDEAMAYVWPMALIATLAVGGTWLLLMQGVNQINSAFGIFVTNGVTSAQSLNTVAHTISFLGVIPFALLIGFFIFVVRGAANTRNAGWAGSITPFVNGMIYLVLSGFLAFIFAQSAGVILDSIEMRVLDPAHPIAQISEDWQEVQGQSAYWINLVMLIPYIIELLGAFLFFQSILATSSGGAQYSRGGYYG